MTCAKSLAWPARANQKFEKAPGVDFACRNPCGVDFSISYADRGDCTFAVRLIEVTPRPSHE